MAQEPDNLVLALLRDMRSDMADGFSDLRSEIKSLRADVASDLHTLDAKVDKTRKELSEQIVGLRRAVVEYHSSAVGHGVLFSELEERVRRLEQHLNLPAGEAH